MADSNGELFIAEIMTEAIVMFSRKREPEYFTMQSSAMQSNLVIEQ